MMFFARKDRSTVKADAPRGGEKTQAGPAPDCTIWNDIARALGQSARASDAKGGRK